MFFDFGFARLVAVRTLEISLIFENCFVNRIIIISCWGISVAVKLILVRRKIVRVNFPGGLLKIDF